MNIVVTPPADSSHELLVTVPGSDHAHLRREIYSVLPTDPHVPLRHGHLESYRSDGVIVISVLSGYTCTNTTLKQ